LSKLDALRGKLESLGVDLYLEVYLPNIRYLTGFSGSNAFLFVGDSLSLFVSDSRYEEQSKGEVRDAEIFIYSTDVFECKERLPKKRLRLGIPEEHITCSFYKRLQEKLEDFEIVLVSDPVKEFRIRKDEDEIEKIKGAQSITDRIFTEILDIVEPGMTELDLAAEIEYRMKKFGAEKPSFETIVASGPHSALPHAKPRDVVIENETVLLMDFGNYYRGYASDMTRTVWVGKNPDREFVKIYDTVRRAQEKAEKEARPGMTGEEIDRIARDVIEGAGYGRYFGHSLGHGVGIEVHELPRISKTGKDPVLPGTVFTVEPGIYIPGFGGVRIEDLVVMTDHGVEILTESPKNLIKI